MFFKLIVQTIGAALGFYIASNFVTGVHFGGGIGTLALAGFLFALFYLVLAPIIKLITFPLRILTFNLFSLVIDMAVIWVVDGLVPQLRIIGLLALLLTTLIILVINAILWQISSPSRK